MVLDNITNVMPSITNVKVQDKSNITLRGLQRTARASAPAVGGSAAPQTPRSPTPRGAQARGRSADGHSAPPSREASPIREPAARPAVASSRAVSSRLGAATASSAARSASRGREPSTGRDGPSAAAPARRTPSASRERSARAASPKARREDSNASAPAGDRGVWANALWDQRERYEASCSTVAERKERRAALKRQAAAAKARADRFTCEGESISVVYGSAALDAEDKRQAEVCAELDDKVRATLAAEEAKTLQLDAGLKAKADHLERHKAQLEEVRAAKAEKVAEVGAKVRLSEDLAEAVAEAREKRAQRAESQSRAVQVARQEHNFYLSWRGNIRVFCRLRPRLPAEADEEVNISIHEDSKLTARSNPQRSVTGMTERSSTWDFDFDHVFGTGASQEAVFEEIQLLVQSALDGYKVAIFAYGQTGSGKTHTMAGDAGEAGVIPRAVDLIFNEIQELKEKGWHFEVHATLLEVYNEAVCDVLASKSSAEAASGGPQYSTRRVEDAVGVHALLRRAAQKRHVAATACNDRSSRSHAVFQLAIEGRCAVGGRKKEVQGLLSLVDLAGSERVEKSGAVGERLKEAQHINKSLSALGDVIEALGRRGQSGKESHVPYRNSRLTTLLKDSLGGESKTLMFVNISPCLRHLTETLSSLRFASKVHACNVGVAKRHAADGSAGAAASATSAAARLRSKSCPASPQRYGKPAEGLPESSWADIF